MLSWDERFAQLKAFKERHGHCMVTVKYDRQTATGLAQWVHEQRLQLRREKKTERGRASAAVKIAALDVVGFEWKPGKRNRLSLPHGMNASLN